MGARGAVLVPSSPEAVDVNTGTGATAVRVGNGVMEEATGAVSVLNCDSNEVLVTDGTRRGADVWLGTPVWGTGVDVMVSKPGVPVRGWRR